MNEPTNLLVMFILNFAVTVFIIRFVYYPSQRSKEYVFTFFALNAVTFLISSLLFSVDVSVSFGFGLFAIFSILRYRTDPIPTREMTYLFVTMTLPIFNAVLVSQSQWASLLVANLTMVVVLYVVEKEWGFQYEIKKSITYEKIDLIKPENRFLLLKDLQQRTGLPIKRLEIGRIDFLRDTAEIKIYYDGPSELVTSSDDAPTLRSETALSELLVLNRDGSVGARSTRKPCATFWKWRPIPIEENAISIFLSRMLMPKKPGFWFWTMIWRFIIRPFTTWLCVRPPRLKK